MGLRLIAAASACEKSGSPWIKKIKESGRRLYKIDKSMFLKARLGPEAIPGDVRAYM